MTSSIAALRRSLISTIAQRNVLARNAPETVASKAFVAALTSNMVTIVAPPSNIVRSFATEAASTMDTMETGTKMYMSLYPEGSTDGSLRLGNIVPDFKAETTHGTMESFHEWKKGKWAILFSVSKKLLQRNTGLVKVKLEWNEMCHADADLYLLITVPILCSMTAPC
jgi:hypothetical protein